jgi:hypothetical protein
MRTKCWFKNLKGRDCFENLGEDCRIIFKWVFKAVRCEDVDWIHLAKDEYQWWALVSMEITL